jgi:hypothetical protein
VATSKSNICLKEFVRYLKEKKYMDNPTNHFTDLASFYLSSMNIGNQGHFHMSGGPTINGTVSGPSGSSQAGSSSANLMKCPECHQTFSEVVSLFAHAAHTHYWNILASLFMSDFLLINGKCRVCNRGPKLKSGMSE